MSTANLWLRAGKLEAILVLADADARQLIQAARDEQRTALAMDRRDWAAALNALAPTALLIKANDRILVGADSRCHFDEAGNANVHLSWPVQDVSTLEIQAQWLARLPRGHRQFLALQDIRGETRTEQLLSEGYDAVKVELELAPTPRSSGAAVFREFLILGVKHILSGYDHLLFLFSLLIVSRKFLPTLGTITCFTVAHSITLALATLGFVHIPSRIVEPIIAASIVYVSLENLLRGDAVKGRSALTFAFGLVHGLGFASVLEELGVNGGTGGTLWPLFSFNLGVELGQILVAVVLLPLIWRGAGSPLFVKRWVPAGSALAGAAGAYWLVERIWLG